MQDSVSESNKFSALHYVGCSHTVRANSSGFCEMQMCADRFKDCGDVESRSDGVCSLRALLRARVARVAIGYEALMLTHLGSWSMCRSAGLFQGSLKNLDEDFSG